MAKHLDDEYFDSQPFWSTHGMPALAALPGATRVQYPVPIPSTWPVLGKVHRHLEFSAYHWVSTGKPGASLLTGLRLLTMLIWAQSQGGKASRISDVADYFLAKSELAQPLGWREPALSAKDRCTACADSQRISNLAVCAACLKSRCFDCLVDCPRSANGNQACWCGGEYVV